MPGGTGPLPGLPQTLSPDGCGSSASAEMDRVSRADDHLPCSAHLPSACATCSAFPSQQPSFHVERVRAPPIPGAEASSNPCTCDVRGGSRPQRTQPVAVNASARRRDVTAWRERRGPGVPLVAARPRSSRSNGATVALATPRTMGGDGSSRRRGGVSRATASRTDRRRSHYQTELGEKPRFTWNRTRPSTVGAADAYPGPLRFTWNIGMRPTTSHRYASWTHRSYGASVARGQRLRVRHPAFSNIGVEQGPQARRGDRSTMTIELYQWDSPGTPCRPAVAGTERCREEGPGPCRHRQVSGSVPRETPRWAWNLRKRWLLYATSRVQPTRGPRCGGHTNVLPSRTQPDGGGRRFTWNGRPVGRGPFEASLK